VSTTAEFPFVLPQAPAAQQDEPTWEIAFLYPTQGNWTEEDYLALDTNWLVELSDGFLEVLPMPTPYHQLLVDRLHKRVQQHVEPLDLGRAFFAPLPIRLWPRKFREPDVVFIRKEKLADLRRQPESADLVMEVVSEGEESRQRDLVTKREEYAKAHIGEYWIVDPERTQITVLVLDGDAYGVHVVFSAGQIAASVLLPGLTAAVDEIFAA
jgi:Uma2 family endonuclease